MKTQLASMENPAPPTSARWRNFRAFALVCLLPIVTGGGSLHAVIPSRESPRQIYQLAGFYKVASSNDPVFPQRPGQEWFLDFGKGVTDGGTSGSVAVSLRRNPNLQVRILVWEVFPNKGNLVIGNQFAEGAKGAVAMADWKMHRSGEGVRLERGSYHVVLHEADPND